MNASGTCLFSYLSYEWTFIPDFLEAVTGWARFFSFFVDLQKEMERDTIANRQIWNKLFQREVLATD